MPGLKVCSYPHCTALAEGNRCPAHQQQTRQHERRFQRGRTNYNTARWIRLRDQFRTEHPFCVNADKSLQACTLTTDAVDHIVPHEGDETLMYNPQNLQAMCWSCHSRKTAEEVRARQAGGTSSV